ncbi:hypothetical protein CASFOL_042631 [Castilleja foliolosa]|uniref:Alanyl-tRNA synthetase class IIc N-terminal domain-containing protein n=1 Tax=Castilleja foliolosa TaxID=1961234 RepID=A0ABD3B864_9LAMI
MIEIKKLDDMAQASFQGCKSLNHIQSRIYQTTYQEYARDSSRSCEHPSVIKATYTGSEFLESVAPVEEVGLILETTSFYAEQGGQIFYTFDTGTIEGHVKCSSSLEHSVLGFEVQ